MQPTFTLERSPRVLLEPQGMDWSYQRVSSPKLNTARIGHIRGLVAAQEADPRRLLAWPTPTTGWKPAGTYPGVLLTSLGCSATDTVPNGPASAYPGGSVPVGLNNRLFFLTKEGKFLKVDKSAPATGYTSLALGTTFTKTYISLSPACTRAYCLADNGTLFIIDTSAMTVLATRTVGGGVGIAPSLDLLLSAANDSSDTLYVPGNDGNISKFTIGPGTPVTITGPTVYAVATTAVPFSGSNKLASPAVVLDGEITIGDMAGYIRYYNTNDTTLNVNYLLGNKGIEAAPAIEIQDNSYALTDSLGNPATVAFFRPIYAFVNVSTINGPMCAWVDLVSNAVRYSQPTYFDDGDIGNKADNVRNYNLASNPTTAYLVAQDGGNIPMDGTNLPDTGTPCANDYLKAAQTNLTGAPAVNYPVGDKPGAIDIDAAGNIWVTNANVNTVSKLSNAGVLLGTFAVGVKPKAIAIDATGNAWVVNETDNTVSKLSNAGVLLGTFAVGVKPAGIEVDPSGNVWVTNSTDNTVSKLSNAGALLGTFAVGTKPKAIAIDSSGNAWVANESANTVTKLSPAGATLGTFAVGTKPKGIATDSAGNVWVANETTATITKLSNAGAVLGTFAMVAGDKPVGITVDAADNVWVTSSARDKVTKFANDGTVLEVLTVGDKPLDVVTDAAGAVWTVNEITDNVTKATLPGGGPVTSFLRFTDPNLGTYAPGSRINTATLSLTVENTQVKSYPAAIYTMGGTDANGSTGVYYQGTTNLWQSNCGLTAANAPIFGTNIGIWQGGGIGANGTVTYNSNTQYDWDVGGGLSGPFPVSNYAFGYRFNTADTFGKSVYYQGGPLTANYTGNAQPYYGPKFRNNPLNVDPSAASGAGDIRPLLTLDISVARYIPNQAVLTPPIIDSVLKKVYVFNTNYLYCMDFSSPANWVDASATMTTTFNMGYYGKNGGATLNNKASFIQNATAPIATYDMSAIYVYNFYPQNGQTTAAPYANYSTAITKILLPLTPGTDRSSPTTGSPGKAVSNTLTNASVNSGYLTSAGASSYMVNDPFSNPSTTGGGIYFGLDGTKMIYHFDP